MKKALKIILVVWAVLVTAYSVLVTGVARTFSLQLDELEKDYDKIELEFTNYKNDITLTRGLAYELLFEFVCRETILKEDYDLNAEIDKRTEQYKLTDDEKISLLLWIDILTEKYIGNN